MIGELDIIPQFYRSGNWARARISDLPTNGRLPFWIQDLGHLIPESDCLSRLFQCQSFSGMMQYYKITSRATDGVPAKTNSLQTRAWRSVLIFRTQSRRTVSSFLRDGENNQFKLSRCSRKIVVSVSMKDFVCYSKGNRETLNLLNILQ